MNKTGINKSVPGFKTEKEILLEYFSGHDVQLSKSEKEKAEIILITKSLLLEHRRNNKVVDILKTEYNVHFTTAYKYIRLTENIFGSPNRAAKEFKRLIAEEMLAETRAVCLKKKDAKGLNANDANYIKLHGLDKEDPEMPDFGALEFHQIIVAHLPEQVSENPMSADELLEKAESKLKEIFEDAEDIESIEIGNNGK